MTKDDLKKLILEFSNDVVFYYANEVVCINPWSASKFEIGWKNNNRICESIDELMTLPFFNGKSLNEIATVIELI